eukprot:2514580-Pleurochrysis_carterae.AAC.1
MALMLMRNLDASGTRLLARRIIQGSSLLEAEQKSSRQESIIAIRFFTYHESNYLPKRVL